MSLEGVALGLVEDDPIMGESLVQRLRLEGASVTWWRSRAEASRAISRQPPDIVICDIRLSDGSGEDVFRDIARQPSGPAFLFMTAFADIDQAVRLMKAGAGDYIAKPFEMQTLLSRVQGLASEPRLRAGRAADLRLVRGEAEKVLIERTLGETAGRVGEAARRLNVSRTTLWSRMKVLGIAGGRRVQKPEQARPPMSE